MSFIKDDFILTNETAKKLYHKYAADMQLFANAWTTFGDYWTRTHMPVQVVKQFGL